MMHHVCSLYSLLIKTPTVLHFSSPKMFLASLILSAITFILTSILLCSSRHGRRSDNKQITQWVLQPLTCLTLLILTICLLSVSVMGGDDDLLDSPRYLAFILCIGRLLSFYEASCIFFLNQDLSNVLRSRLYGTLLLRKP